MSQDLKQAIKREYLNCVKDPVHFMRKYCTIQHPQRGKIKFDLYKFQESTLQELADRYDVTAPYIHQVLKANNVPTSRLKFPKTKNKIQCVICEKWGTRKVCLGDCYRRYYFFYVRCRNCKRDWHMKRAQLKQKINRGDKNTYCSRACYFSHKLNKDIINKH